MSGDPGWADYVTALAAAGAVAAAVGVPLTAYARRPRLSIVEDKERIHTRLEAGAAKVPWIRLLVCNRAWRRAAQGTRVLVESYRENVEGSTPVTMGSPELGWPSTEVPVGGGAIVFAGGTRPVDFAALQVVNTSGQKQVASMLSSEQLIASGGHWELRLTLAMHAKNVFITDDGEHSNLWTDISYTLFADDEYVYLLKVLLSDERVLGRVLFGSDFYVVENAELEERRRSLRIRAVLGEDVFHRIAFENPSVYLGQP